MPTKKNDKSTPGKADLSSSCDCPESTWVYIWSMTAEKVGHAAIQVGGCEPKRQDQDNKGEYMSIHPRSIPAIGPTIIFPLPAALSTTLTDDMASEAASLRNDETLEMPTAFRPRHLPTSLPPDYTFKVPNLRVDAMRTLMKTTKEEVETGQTTYQLLPKVNTLTFFKELPQYINYNSIDIINPPRQSHKGHTYGDKKYNCATLVSSILVAGGLPIQQSSMPWGQTPDSLANQLSNFK